MANLQADQISKINSAISILQELLSGKSNTAKTPQPTYPPMPNFDQKLNLFIALSKKLDPEIGILTNGIVKYLQLMKLVMGYSSICRKPDEQIMARIQGLFRDQFKPIQDIEAKQLWRIHAKAIKQLVNGAFWVFTNAPEVVIKSAIEAADFNANKFKRDKKLQINQWYNTLIQAYKALVEYTVEFFPSGLNYNFDGKGSWEDFFASATGKPHTQQPTTSNQPATQQSQQPTQQTQQAQQVPVKKSPVRQNKGGNWYIQNFQNSTIEFNANEVQMRNSFFIQNCKNCVVKLNSSKFKSLMLSKSQKVTIFVGTLLSGIEIMNSKQIQVRILNACPSISVDKSDSIHLVLNGKNKNTDVVSSKVTQLNVTYSVEGQQQFAKDQAVADQIITRWNQKLGKFQSKIYDKFM